MLYDDTSFVVELVADIVGDRCIYDANGSNWITNAADVVTASNWIL